MRIATILLCSAALAFPSIAYAQDDSEAAVEASSDAASDAEIEAMFAKELAPFTEMFEVAPLTAEQEARLPLAQQMVDKTFPVGTFDTIMGETFAPMMDQMMELLIPGVGERLAALTGLDETDLMDRDMEAQQEALDILDPDFAKRQSMMGDVTRTLISEIFVEIEPAYRDAMARAFAKRFTSDEMGSVLQFFATDVGSKYARESILVQYDEQMLGIMEEMGPAMVNSMMSMMASFEQMESELTPERKYSALNAAEQAKLAELLGQDRTTLEEREPSDEEDHDWHE